MIVLPLCWLILANSLPCQPSQGLQKYHLQIVHALGRFYCIEKYDTSLVLLLN